MQRRGGEARPGGYQPGCPYPLVRRRAPGKDRSWTVADQLLTDLDTIQPWHLDLVASRPGAALSAGDSIRITLHGRGTQGSMPHYGIDPILLGSAAVMRLNAIVSRELPAGHFP